MNYLLIRQRPAQFKALTSLTVNEFDQLLPHFEQEWTYFIQHFTLDGQRRSRAYKPLNETQLPSPAHKLFFVLVYQKTKRSGVPAASRIPGRQLCHRCVDDQQVDSCLVTFA